MSLLSVKKYHGIFGRRVWPSPADHGDGYSLILLAWLSIIEVCFSITLSFISGLVWQKIATVNPIMQVRGANFMILIGILG